MRMQALAQMRARACICFIPGLGALHPPRLAR